MTQKTHAHRALFPGSVRLAALVLIALALCAALPARPARAAEWMIPYLEQVQEWGVMRGDANGNLNEDRPVTRAEFVTMVNRAFGYTEVGPHTFTDVPDNAWYAQDISIAHQAGYFGGTSATTASPLSLVTREQAAVLLGRCLRLQGVTGAANSTFTDMRDIGGWSRGLVQEAADMGIIGGYSDGTFRPRESITRGQLACFLVRALGTLIQEPGEQSSGGVYGNLTVTVPGVKLKDSIITGNLYLTGGVGLGSVELENVQVLGKIVICGTGEAESGKNSVILRNVTAGALEVDSLTEQFLSVQAEGLTDIGTATIRTSAYLEDLTEDGLGFKTIRLDGAEGAQLQLAGNIKQVVDLTPNSALQIAQGVAAVVTMDEKALNASLTIDNQAYIKELNLDAATPVTGAGSITHLNINAPGSNVSMLPDTIYVRPGITGNVSNVNMDNKAAAESSEDPRLLAGYPKAKNIATTSADAVFSVNKTGAIHWAVTALMDGSVGEEELMNPSAYPKIIRSGTVNANASRTEFTARLTGLTREGSYYISALLEDARGRRSPVKVAAFTTPDDSAPNFANGYPQDPILTTDADGEQVAQIMVMPTKNCQMYYVLLPAGSTAPTAADFRAAALPGNLGYGVVDLRKNTPFLVSRINTSYLQEKTNYDLYLWLNDADNGKSSAVRKVTVTTKDLTPPTIQDLSVTDPQARTVRVTFALDEPGTLSWVVMRQGENLGVNKDNPQRQDQIIIESITAGSNGRIVRRGGPVRAANGGTYYNFTISGLEPQTAYDLYYMAKDTAGNYCVYNKSIEFPYPFKTLDTQPPTPGVDFDPKNEGANGTSVPWADSNVMVTFDEVVRGAVANGDPVDFYNLYLAVQSSSGDARAQAKKALGDALEDYITFYRGTPPTNTSSRPRDEYRVPVLPDGGDPDTLSDWIDYREAEVSQAGAKTVITFPNGKGIKMQSGETYYFRLENIEDTSMIPMTPNPTYVPQRGFTTAYATVNLEAVTSAPEKITYQDLNGQEVTKSVKIFSMDPRNTDSVPQDTRWDMLIWANASIRFDLLVRPASSSSTSSSSWIPLGPVSLSMTGVTTGKVYASLNGSFGSRLTDSDVSYLFGDIQPGQGRPLLSKFLDKMEVAVAYDEASVEQNTHMEVQLFAGTNPELGYIAYTPGTSDTLANRNVTAFGEPDPYGFDIDRHVAPTITISRNGIQTDPTAPTDVTVNVSLSSSGNLYYIAVPLSGTLSGSQYILGDGLSDLGGPTVGAVKPNLDDIPSYGNGLALDAPEANSFMDLIEYYINYGNDGLNTHFGKVSNRRTASLEFEDLTANRTYLLFLLSQDAAPPFPAASRVVCYQFTTEQLKAPKIRIETTATTRATLQVDMDSDQVKYILARTYQLQGESRFARTFSGDLLAPGASLPIQFNGISVLEAMTQNDPDELSTYRRTLFDRYASDAAKRTYAEILLNFQNSSFDPAAITPDDPFPLKQYVEYPITIDELQTTSEFTMIAIAMIEDNTGDEPSALYGFRASPAFRVTQDNSLYVLTYSGTYDNQESLNPDNYFSGDITINFTDDLHWQVSQGNGIRIDACAGDQLHPEADDYISQTNRINYTHVFPLARTSPVSLIDPAPLTSLTAHGSLIGDYLTFHMNHASNNTQIVFRSSLCNSDGEVKSGRGPLIVTLKAPDAANSGWRLEFSNDWYKGA